MCNLIACSKKPRHSLASKKPNNVLSDIPNTVRLNNFKLFITVSELIIILYDAHNSSEYSIRIIFNLKIYLHGSFFEKKCQLYLKVRSFIQTYLADLNYVDVILTLWKAEKNNILISVLW